MEPHSIQFSWIIDSDAMVVGEIEEPFALMRVSTAPIAAALAPIHPPTAPFFDKMAGHFNAGVMFIRPNIQHFNELLSFSRDKSYYDLKLAEQNLLNEYYHGRWLGLPVTYNLIITFAKRNDIWKVNRPDARVIHFAGIQKPWATCGDKCNSLHPDEKLWRSTFASAATIHDWTKADFTNKIGFDIGALFNVSKMY
jgi:lipopolysaccharide biosynthesis glycosyltransferase